MRERILQVQLKQGRLKDSGDFPKVILIDTISYCNLRCTMCAHKDMKRKRGVMGWALFTKIIDEIALVDKNTRVWMVFFGEALLLKKEPTIFEMISYTKAKGLTDVVLNSNANLLDEKTSLSLINSNLDAIYIGIDAFSPEVYSKIRVGGDYDKVVDNSIKLIKLKQKMNARNPQVYVQFVEMDINASQKEDFIDFWQAQGAIVKIRPKVSWAGLVNASNQTIKKEERWPCHWAMQTMSITDSGDVVTCAVDVDARYVAGNIKKSSLKEVWNTELKNLRNFHIEGKFDELPGLCKECMDWQSARADYY